MIERKINDPISQHSEKTEEEDYAAPEYIAMARATLLAPYKSTSSGLWLIVSLGLFILAGARNDKAVELGILLGVIFFHEAGHALAMRAFGYQDLKIFFIPFFGGAASGRKAGAPIWQQAVVLFAGPVPGIVVALGMLLGSIAQKNSLLLSVAGSLLLINGFNLAPFAPLDGGRALVLAVTGRHRYLEHSFSVLGAVALAAVALLLQSIVLGIFALLALMGIPRSISIRRESDRIRARHGVLSTDPNALSDSAVAALFNASAAIRPEPYGPARAGALKALWERLATPPPTLAVSALIVVSWVASIGVFLAALVVYSFFVAGPGTSPQ
jgi:Zn-dependent protease